MNEYYSYNKGDVNVVTPACREHQGFTYFYCFGEWDPGDTFEDVLMSGHRIPDLTLILLNIPLYEVTI